MAKLTIAALTAFVKTYVDKALQAGAYSKTTNNFLGLLDKVGKQITIDGKYEDYLPELDGEDLPLGKTIEEYFIDLTLPVDYKPNGDTTLAPHDPTVGEVCYSTSLGEKTIPTTQRYNNIERAALTSEGAANMIGKILERLTQSYSAYKLFIKKQLLGNFADKAVTKGGKLTQVLAIPSDTKTSEAFIKQVKKDVEDASFMNEGHSLANATIGAADSLTLYIKKGIMPEIEVEALAGAFNSDKLAIPATIKVVEDFGTTDNTNIYALLVDPRGVKLHRDYHAIRTQPNGEGDYLNFYDHSEHTAFISKYVYVKAYTSA